jgi:hypothetical protein
MGLLKPLSPASPDEATSLRLALLTLGVPVVGLSWPCRLVSTSWMPPAPPSLPGVATKNASS